LVSLVKKKPPPPLSWRSIKPGTMKEPAASITGRTGGTVSSEGRSQVIIPFSIKMENFQV
jgi:hypothetical protein